MIPKLSQAHFQLTGRCNLSCRFCGQSKGMLASGEGEFPIEKWLSLSSELKELAAEAGKIPEIMLWGGEPLLYPDFDELAKTLHQQGFRLSIVTNATLLDKHLETVAETIECINVSVDGMREVHDSMRGDGVFDQLSRNLGKLNRIRCGSLTFLTTVSDLNVKGISRLPFELAEMGPDSIVLQPLMYLNSKEIADFREYSLAHFHSDYPELNAWHREDDSEYLCQLKKELEIVEKTEYPIPVIYTPHCYPDFAETGHCQAPWNRIHIRHDGAVGFCTDYFSFSAGNVKEQSLREIFFGEKAELFRKAVLEDQLTTCLHCPWHRQKFGFSMILRSSSRTKHQEEKNG